MSKLEKIKAAAKKVSELKEIEEAISEIKKRKRIIAVNMPTTDSMSNRADTVEIPFSMRQISAERVLDGLEAVRKQLLEEIEETNI
jgi:hypothetical protein